MTEFLLVFVMALTMLGCLALLGRLMATGV